MIKKLFYSLLSVIFVSSFQVIALILTSQKATPEQLGILTILISVNAFLFLFVDFGLSNFLLHKKTLSRESILQLKRVNLIISVVILFILAICALIAFWNGENEDIISALWMTGLNTVALALTRIERAKLQSEHRFKDILYLDSTTRVIGIVTLYALLVADVNVVTSYLAVLFGINLLAKCVLLSILRKKAFKYGVCENRGLKEFCFPQAANSILNFLTQNLDILLIASFAGLEISGIYGVIKILSTKPLQIFMPVLLRVYTPKIVDSESYSSVYLQLILLTSIISSILYSCVILVGEYLLVNFFNIVSTEASYALGVFCLYTYLRSVCMPVGVLVTKTGETKRALHYTVFQLISISTMLFFIEPSLENIAISLTVYQIVILLPHWFFLVNKLSSVSILKYHFFALIPITLPLFVFYIGTK